MYITFIASSVKLFQTIDYAHIRMTILIHFYYILKIKQLKKLKINAFNLSIL